MKAQGIYTVYSTHHINISSILIYWYECDLMRTRTMELLPSPVYYPAGQSENSRGPVDNMWKSSGSVLLICFISSTWGRVTVSGSDLIEAECSQLSEQIRDEIKSYKGVTDRIIKEITSGKYAGVTYQR